MYAEDFDSQYKREMDRKLPEELLALDSQPYALWKEALGTSWISNFRLREPYITNVGFPIMTAETLSELVKFCEGKKVLDAGCGTGFISYNLRKNGIDVIAVDSEESRYCFTDEKPRTRQNFVVKGNALDHLTPDIDIVIMSWPDYQPDFSLRIAKKLQVGQYLIYQGEGNYGCTGCDKFHELVDTGKFLFLDHESAALNEQHLKFGGIHDSWYVYQRVSKNLMPDEEIRRIVHYDFPNFPPFLLTQDEFQLRLNAVHHFKDYSFVQHARQQCMLSEAFAAKRRGESTDYLYELAKIKKPIK